MKMKKELQLVVDLIENSISYELGQIDYHIDGNNISVFAIGHNTFHSCSLIGLIAKIDKVNCYMDYNKETDKVELRIF